MAKKKNPQDATLRNTRAATKRLANLERRVRLLERKVGLQQAPSEPSGSSLRGHR